MTQKDFFETLHRLVEEDGYTAFLEGNRIRLKKDGKCFCPVTAIHFYKTGEFLEMVSFYHVNLRIRNVDRDDLINIADGWTSTTNEKRRVRMRRSMLKALGLNEEKKAA